MKGLLLLFFLLFTFLFVVTEYWFRNGKKPIANGKYAYAIVLGAKLNGKTPSLTLQYRLDAAIDYIHLYPQTILIVSGGQGPDEDISEAQVMFNYLVKKGVSESQLICEDQSTSTYENFLFTKRLLSNDFKGLTIISNDYHLARAQKTAKKLGIQTDVFPSQTPSHVKVKFVTRERFALLGYLFRGK